MPLTIPSLDDLRAQNRNFYAARLPGADTSLRRSGIMVAAEAQAAMEAGEYLFLARLPNDVLLPDSAIQPYLDRWASWYGLTREAATFAAGAVQFAGTSGFPIPAGALIERSDHSAQYATQADATIGGGGTVNVAVLATIGGAAGNAPAGAPLGLVVAIAGVNPTATVRPAGLTGGVDQESDASLQARLRLRVQHPPQGGAPLDYVAWAKGNGITDPYPGVTRAWCFPKVRGLGTVDVTFVMDGRTNIIPLSADIDAVQAELNYVKAAGDVLVAALIPDHAAITIGSLTPDSAATRAAVRAGLAALFATTTPANAMFGDGVSVAAPGGKVWLADIVEAVKASVGVLDFDLVVPAADIAPDPGHIVLLGTVSFA